MNRSSQKQRNKQTSAATIQRDQLTAYQKPVDQVLTPLIDRKSVELPPVLTITAQVPLGLVFGFIGILLASPLTAAAMILVRMLYVEDVLGDYVMSGGSESEGEKRGGKRTGDEGRV